jgi:hypothetical protein
MKVSFLEATGQNSSSIINGLLASVDEFISLQLLLTHGLVWHLLTGHREQDITALVNSDDPSPYVIISHTWADGEEVTYSELLAGTGKNKTGYTKVCFCGDMSSNVRMSRLIAVRIGRRLRID